ADVAGLEEPVRGEHGRRLLRLVVVATHDGDAAQLDLAVLAEADLHVGDRLAHGAEPGPVGHGDVRAGGGLAQAGPPEDGETGRAALAGGGAGERSRGRGPPGGAGSWLKRSRSATRWLNASIPRGFLPSSSSSSTRRPIRNAQWKTRSVRPPCPFTAALMPL